MTKPSKGGAAFFVVFGLMFLVPGLIALSTFLTRETNSGASGKLVGVAIALFISAIGAGFILAALFGFKELKKQAALEEANPTSPWLWRADWSNRRSESAKKNSQIGAWVACILVNLITIPITAYALPQFFRRNDPKGFLIVGFSLVGVILFANALRATLRHRRFGNTYFEFYSLPFSPGGKVAGRIHLALDANASHGIDVRLACVRKTMTGTGNNSSMVETILWQSDRNISSTGIESDPFGKMIPVDFQIPPNAYVTDRDNPSDQVIWRLHAQADIPGIDYTDDFELPVFGTANSMEQPPADFSSPGIGFASNVSSDANEAPVSAPPNTRVVISSRDGGTEFYFPAFRTPSRALFLVCFTAIWTGVVFFLFHSRAPLIFAIVFGFFDVLMIFAAFHVVFGTARIRVGSGEIASTKRTLGIGSTKRFAVSEIEAIVPVTSGQQSGTHGDSMYAIRLRTKNGRRITLADEIASRQEARWIVSQIESLAGMKLDTHVELDSPFGAPPQPGQPLFDSSQRRSLSSGWQQPRPQSRTASIISFVIFFAVTASMFGWQAWNFAKIKKVSRNSPVSNARAAAASRSKVVPVRQVFSGPMTDADAERILALPAQEQAEELLERAIGHDDRARDLFEQNVENWIGRIRLTDRMRQLEHRSEYSSDLRVRFVNADINLALDGWQKNEEAAGMLIDRAKSDLQYRAAAVYFLGMLAGRGVAYDRIHPVLLNYAKHDPDTTVRQWAVEGMRYIGKDQALDELFESFTNDPSNTVRDRAGCNISDCGNFTRVQRMRMVPKFFDLISDASTNSQMRTWCYMALREITDMNLPSDPQSWKNWYREHGAEKLAEFQKREWWQVRGDE